MGLRAEKKALQRRAILDTAVALFRKRGYEQTRVQDIIERLRISEATFFNYFPAKEALLQELARDELDISIATVRAELERNDRSVPDRIRVVIRQWALGWSLDRKYHALVASRSRMLSGGQALRTKAMLLYDLYEALFAEGQRRGEIRTDTRPLELAEMLEGIFITIGGNWLFGWWKDRTDPLEERFMNALDVFLDGCKPVARQTTQTRPTVLIDRKASTRRKRPRAT